MRDHYVGAMRGVALGICPDVTLADITHEIDAQDVLGGALELAGVNVVMDLVLMTGVIWATGDIESPIIAIYTIEGAPMATAGPEMGDLIKAELAQRGIGFHPQKKTARVDSAARRIVLEDGAEASFDLLITVPPHEAPKVVRDAGLVNASGWVPVDPQTLEVKSPAAAGRVYAAGQA